MCTLSYEFVIPSTTKAFTNVILATNRCTQPLTFLATKSITSREAIKHPAAILAVRRFVDASIKTIPQKDEPRSRVHKR